MNELRAGLPAETDEGRARRTALDGHPLPEGGHESVDYHAGSRLLVLGPQAGVIALAERVPAGLELHVLLTDTDTPGLGHPDVAGLGRRALRGWPVAMHGHLGAFSASVAGEDAELDLAGAFGLAPRECFDLVIDLCDPPLLRQELPPPGYFRPQGQAEEDAALEAALGLVGEFEKPRYFRYEADLCVHGNRGKSGCTACLDVCATEAIRSLGERIEVDPYLCQGCGSCATVCPTGAMRYAWPPPETLLEHLRGLLRDFRSAGGHHPVIVFHDGEAGAAALADWAPTMPESVLPIEVEDAGSVGPEVWLSALAYGAGRVLVLLAPDTPPSERAATGTQIEIAGEMLRALGFPSDRIVRIEPDGRLDALAETPAPLVERPATHTALGSKREILHRALLHLHAAAGSPDAVAPLPAGASHGEVVVDREACTLCMACVSVCPTQALSGGGERPLLTFREDLCVQCGLCDRSCPEDAITLSPRIDFGALATPEARPRNEEEPHHCPGCGKAFATRKLIERTEQRLAGHWMFAGESARRRLRLCEDCRVEAILRDEGSIDPYRDR